ncbi:MAG: MarR family transcriptional regulator [Geminicoccaceae bacterium]|nr:MarR family transcriptional regulator [Geminicoccaceae bacterium]MCS7266550.1 MarR family transcriptional regulator [Geminicoccaceae bacterium]MCX7628977.1 MarR family transcriptional regulator [Geminicoccaceae bacterium]MDW8125627.1 MarR family transcriptional regulator [Geminicoccaceae bacterium]MDW8340083.1 MarR family transcriptional regulator [Geminicoccaceae bacterium]
MSVNATSKAAFLATRMAGRASPLFLRDAELERALELLLLAERGLAARSAAALRAARLDERDLDILWLLRRRPGITAHELASLLSLPKQSVSRHLRALEAGGLVLRGEHGTDRRRRVLRLSERGASLVESLAEPRKRGLRRAFQSAGAEAVAGFERVLGELAHSASPRLEEPAKG